MVHIFQIKNIRTPLWGLALVLLGIGMPSQYAQTQQVRAQDVMLWKAGQGLINIGSCRLTAVDQTAFQLVEYTGSGESNFENIRSFEGDVIHKVPNHSLVRIVDGQKNKDRYRYAEVLGSFQNSEKNQDLVDTSVGQQKYEGYIFGESLQTIENHAIHILKYDEHSIYGKKATNTFWVPKESGDQFLSVDCGQPVLLRPLVFEVYSISSNDLLGIVAVDPADAEIFNNIKTLSIENMRQVFSSAHNGRPIGVVATSGTITGEPEPRPAQGGTISGSIIGSADPATPSANGSQEDEELELEDDNYDSITDEETGDEYIDEDIPIYEGNLEYIICTSDSQLNVRPYNDMTEVLFKANRHEKVIPMESFNNDERFAVEINGDNVVFIKVQFPDRDRQIGWVAESYVSEVSRCASYQVRLGDDQPIICTDSGTVNVRDETFAEILFKADRFSPVAIRSDAEDSAKTFVSGDQSYEMIPVTFITKDSQEGWIAKDFVKTKKQCEAYKQQDECCNFPIASRPTHNYTNGMRAFGAGRDKGKRKHAGVDLYSTDGARVSSVDSGRVRRNIYHFYLDTYAIEVTHNNFVVRYGELYPTASSGVTGGSTVRTGQSLGTIKKIRSLNVRPMLHFEMYGTKASGTLSGGGAYKRRSDLKNPTRDLQKWERQKFGVSY